MPILASDVKLAKSTVMLDVPEGGGPPSPNLILDGNSNEVFDDISEAARAGGQVSIRKVHVVVHTEDTDGFFGGNVIVADPPNDPNVSVTLFTTKQTFDRRSDAVARVEAYLNKGTEWDGFLFENHIAGQRIIQLFARPEAEVPNVGRTLVLVYDEGLVSQKEQYVRITKVSVVIRMFYDPDEKKDYPAAVISLDLSDPLRYDYKGSPPARSFRRAKDSTITRDTTVADAGSYVGVVPLKEPIALGDFTARGTTIYTQLVPNAQIETPIADSRPTQQTFAMVKAGSSLIQDLTLVFTTSQQMFIGGGILPGSLTVTRGGITLKDDGGDLVNGTQEVGQVDYENGVLTLLTNVWGTSGGTHTVTYVPASRNDGSFRSVGYPIFQESRSLSYVFTLQPIAQRRTLTVSYMVGYKWYVLREKGNGVIKGSDEAFGAGTYNFETGTLLVTLGALPDVGSSIIIQWIELLTNTQPSTANIQRMARWAMPMNTKGWVSNTVGDKGILPSGLTITWMGPDNIGKSCVDDGYGRLTGDAQGTVLYSQGVVWWSPNLLPAKTTMISMDINGALQLSQGAVPIFGGTISANLAPRSLYMEVQVKVMFTGKSFNSDSSGGSSGGVSSTYKSWYPSSSYNRSNSYSSSSGVSNTIVDEVNKGKISRLKASDALD